ncbi:MAG TPA: cell division protein ZapE [Rickettsiales bacterium]|nr:cell division protein ZapE [Rickettsiales bacterium]
MDRKIHLDQHQGNIYKHLQDLAYFIEHNKKESFLTKFLPKKPKKTLKSLYLYSPPGYGKTMLMQKFYQKLKKTPKIYFHFNSFMRAIHEALRDIRNEKKNYKDELIEAIKRIISDKKVLCFDEFQVHDIADAMILGRIFSYLFSQNTFLIITSNSKPQDLYKNGLQREIFMQFVEKIFLKNVVVLKLENQIDYRLQYKKNLSKHYFIESEKSQKQLQEIIEHFTKSKPLESSEIKVWGRVIKLKKTFENIAIFDFAEICKTNLAATDYKEICKKFDLIFLLNLPKITAQDKNEAWRLMLFIDEIYENKTALIILAKTEIDEIFIDKKDKETNVRMLSRLYEIKSDQYWQNSKFIKA